MEFKGVSEQKNEKWESLTIGKRQYIYQSNILQK